MADLCSIIGNANNPCCMPEGDVTLPTICSNDVIPTEEPHEPPMGFEDGSLCLSWNHEIVERNDSPTTNDPRPRKYIVAEAGRRFGPIAVVRVLTERGSGSGATIPAGTVGFTRYILPRDTGARLLIWLQQLTSNSNESNFAYEPKTTEPQIALMGGDFLLETDRQLYGKQQTYKTNRQCGYEHPGFARHFRIAAWQIVGANGLVVKENNAANGTPFADANQEAYKLYVSFHG